MYEEIIHALEGRRDLLGWTARHIVSRGSQLYLTPVGPEAERRTSDERFVVDVLVGTTRDGQRAVGAGNVTLLPGDDVAVAIEAAALRAGLAANPPYGLPGPAPLPDVPLTDAALAANMPAALQRMAADLQAAVATESGIRMTAAELYAEEETVRLRNSRGIDATQSGTRVAVEWVLQARDGGNEVETFVEMTRRRAQDMPLAEEVARRSRWTRDLLRAGPPPQHQGAVVLRDAALAEFMATGVIQFLGSAAAKFTRASGWEPGKSVFGHEPTGDPLNVWANRAAAYGAAANRFDGEGIPAQRLPLIQENALVNWSASQRYADYLGAPATGEFGVIEVAPGSRDVDALLAAPHVEVAAFSWFNPDEVTGDFACEIRLGYVVEGGERRPFKGGQLIGNVMDALAAARWSREVGAYGDYMGPVAVRFEELVVAL